MRYKPNARKLKRNHKTRVPQYFCFVDTETTPTEKENGTIEQIFKLGVSIFKRRRKDSDKHTKKIVNFTDKTIFWENVDNFIKGKNTLHIVAHNAFFDMTVLQFQTNLTKLGYECKFLFNQGVTFISKWQNQDKRIMILDNSNWFTGKLSKWGDILGLEKLPMPDFNAPNDGWFTYCLRDVEILEHLQDWLIKFLQDNDLGNWKYTIASLAFNAYRHRFMDYPIYIPEKTRETFLSRNSYKGGRTECFYSGKAKGEKFYKLDVNSMYPYVMRNNNFPTNVEGYINKPTIRQIEQLLDKYSLCGYFKVNVGKPYFPYKVNNKTCYPVGVMDLFLTTPEIQLALENGWLLECYELSVYRHRPIFRSYIDFFYGERLKHKRSGNELMSTLFKLFQNTLYGKFGQRGFNDKIIGEAKPGTIETSYYYDSVTGKRGIIRQIGKNILLSEKEGEAHNAFVVIASHVTSFARIYLYSLIEKAGHRNVYYCDTDSIICNSIGYMGLYDFVDANTLGMLKVEGIADELEIISPKHYGFGKEWKIKGVSKNSKKIDKFTYEQEIWPGVNRIIQEDEEYYFNYTITKHLTAKVSSGIINSDGFVTPYIIKD